MSSAIGWICAAWASVTHLWRRLCRVEGRGLARRNRRGREHSVGLAEAVDSSDGAAAGLLAEVAVPAAQDVAVLDSVLRTRTERLKSEPPRRVGPRASSLCPAGTHLQIFALEVVDLLLDAPQILLQQLLLLQYRRRAHRRLQIRSHPERATRLSPCPSPPPAANLGKSVLVSTRHARGRLDSPREGPARRPYRRSPQRGLSRRR